MTVDMAPSAWSALRNWLCTARKYTKLNTTSSGIRQQLTAVMDGLMGSMTEMAVTAMHTVRTTWISCI